VDDNIPWHTLSVSDVAQQLRVDAATGLTSTEAAERLLRDGYNEIADEERRSLLRMLLSQFTDFMILVLLAAALISGIAGSLEDTLAILVIVTLNALVGAFQEYRAERAILALRKMAAPDARVLRDGRTQTIAARDLAQGDVVLLEAGNVVPSDLRLVECAGLEIDEAALTGESLAVAKATDPLAGNDSPLGDRRNMAYKGTQITRGRGAGVVAATGMSTELGKIAGLLKSQQDIKTPLQKRLARFGKRLAWAVLAICGLIFAAGLLRGEPVLLMFLTAVSLAVAAIPEALPAVVTVSLAIGARTMSHHKALVRNLPAVETLGSVTFICSDKTGTLTQNAMHLESLWAGGREYAEIPAGARRLGQALALNNDISTVMDNHNQTAEAQGEPTELALFQAAAKSGFDKATLAEEMPRVAELPFDAERKRMSTLHAEGSRIVVFVKGAPESVLPLCNSQLDGDGVSALDINATLAWAEASANNGYRVLALALREFSSQPEPLDIETVESQLTLLGLVALLDPPRPEAKAAVAECLSAGITPVMITGDHPGTALAIARRMNIVDDDATVLTGAELERMSLAEFEQQVEHIRVYARVSPAQKIKIVQALQDKGQFVAMTGDGVNDAPALKGADIGVAMGLKGTEVAREAADMVLLDDNFATIVAAVREGRRIFDNIRKFIKYTMTSNSGEIWTLFLAPFLGLPLPLLPIHILWINLVTDGLPGLALSVEPAERGIMQRPPRPPNESIFAGGMWQHMLWVGLLIGGLSILAQAWAIHDGSAHWQTMTFTVLTLSQLMHAMVIRTEKDSLFTVGILSNKTLLGAVLFTVLLQMAVIYLPFFNDIFKTQPLSPRELAICFALPLVVFVAVEVEKWFKRRLK
jgi:Ca2+-transporting ATPase